MCDWLRKLGKFHHLTFQSNWHLQNLPVNSSPCSLCTVTFISVFWQLVFMSEIKALQFAFPAAVVTISICCSVLDAKVLSVSRLLAI